MNWPCLVKHVTLHWSLFEGIYPVTSSLSRACVSDGLCRRPTVAAAADDPCLSAVRAPQPWSRGRRATGSSRWTFRTPAAPWSETDAPSLNHTIDNLYIAQASELVWIVICISAHCTMYLPKLVDHVLVGREVGHWVAQCGIVFTLIDQCMGGAEQMRLASSALYESVPCVSDRTHC